MKVALAHDYLTQRGGAERVALEFCRSYPDAPLYTSVYDGEGTYPEFEDVDIRCSPLQRFESIRRDPRIGLPILASAWTRTRVEDADVVLISSSGWAHGLSTPASVPKVVYCHNPPRWLYQADMYAQRKREKVAIQLVQGRLRRWDQRAAASAHTYIANSRAVARRVREAYGIEPEIIFPPVTIDPDAERDPIPGVSPGYFLTVSRARGYKNVELIVKAVASMPDVELVVVGSRQQVSHHEAARNIHWVGRVTDAQLRWLYANARALVTVAFEDFGLTPLEANVFGTPVAALRAGGHLDSVAEGTSGCWIEEPTVEAVRDVLQRFPQFDPSLVKAHAARFSAARFRERIAGVLMRATWEAPRAA